MLMMLAFFGRSWSEHETWAKGLATDAHDAGLRWVWLGDVGKKPGH